MDFIANKTLTNYLPLIGFKRQKVDSDKMYYTNSNRKQVRIDLNTKEISLIGSNGNTIVKKFKVSNTELIIFGKG